MMQPDQVLPFSLQAAEVNVVLAALGELPYRVAQPVIDRIKGQILALDPAAFTPVQATIAPEKLNGEAPATH